MRIDIRRYVHTYVILCCYCCVLVGVVVTGSPKNPHFPHLGNVMYSSNWFTYIHTYTYMCRVSKDVLGFPPHPPPIISVAVDFSGLHGKQGYS